MRSRDSRLAAEPDTRCGSLAPDGEKVPTITGRYGWHQSERRTVYLWHSCLTVLESEISAHSGLNIGIGRTALPEMMLDSRQEIA
jgi:hypothetical protein